MTITTTLSRRTLLDALRRAEGFMSGFEDDPEQEGVNETLVLLRECIDTLDAPAAAASARVSEVHRCKAPGCEQIHGHTGAHGARP